MMCYVLYTQKCVICGSAAIDTASGHVVRFRTFIDDGEYKDLHIIASRCTIHAHTLPKYQKQGYYGEYKEWMGICDNPWKKPPGSLL
jgi:hypothetical protein